MSQPPFVRRHPGVRHHRAILLGWLLGVALTCVIGLFGGTSPASAQSPAPTTDSANTETLDQPSEDTAAVDGASSASATTQPSPESAAPPDGSAETPTDGPPVDTEETSAAPGERFVPNLPAGGIPWQGAGTERGDGPTIVEQAPRILFTRDQQGKLWPLVNIPWERIQALLNAEDIGNLQPLAPRFQITLLTIQGQVVGDAVEMSLELRVSLPAPTAGGRVAAWTLIPLRLPDASLLAQPEHEGSGKLFVVYRDLEGYQAWIQHEKAGDHLIRLRIAMPLDEAAGATRLQLLLPAATQSRLELDVPGEQVSVEADGGRRAVVSAAPEARSRIAVTDLRNQLTLSWTTGADIAARQPANFDVVGDVRVSVDGPGAIRSQVALELQSYGRPIDRCLLRLPPHTSIVSGNQPGYELRELPLPTRPDSAAGAATGEAPGQDDVRREVEVTLLKPAPQVRLQFTTQTSRPEGSASATSIGSFEVVGAIRQSGQIALLANEDWRVDWTLGPSVRRVATSEVQEATGDRRALATFQYFRQPCRLEVETRAQETRTTVRPRYRMHVEEDRVELEAQFDYRLRGARVGSLNCALHGWILDDVGPNGSVEEAPLEDTPAATGTAASGDARQVRLRLTRPATGDMTLTLRLHRPITEPRGTLRLALPSPAADGILPGTLFVSSGDAVVLSFREAEMTGLVPDARAFGDSPDIGTPTPLSPTRGARDAGGFLSPDSTRSTDANRGFSSPPRTTAPSTAFLPGESPAAGTAFRFLGDRAAGEVAMDYQVREQEIRVRMDSELEAAGDALQVTQRIGYRVLYRPTSQLKLDVPRPLFELLANPRYRPQVELRLDGQTLGRESFEDVADSVDALRNIVPINVPLARPRLGNLELRLRFPWPLRPTSPSNPLSVPLATPREGRLLSNLATLRDSSPYLLEPTRELGWIRETPVGNADPKAGQLLSSPQRTSSLQLQVIASQQPVENTAAARSTTIQRAWLQTWLTGQRQHDRAVLRLTTAASRLRLRTAPGVRSLVAIVDGQTATATRDEQLSQEWSIPLPNPQSGEHTLELFLEYTTRPPIGRMRFQWPELSDASPPRRWFWQLIVPQDEHLWSSDSVLTSANRWQREGIAWQREAVQSQASLEEWTEATTQPPIPPGVHDYLFSSFDPAGAVAIHTCSRRTLVYGFSLLALAVACAWTYLPLLRHPLVTMVAATLLAATAWRYAEQAAIAAQAGVLGLVLAAIPAIVRRWGTASEPSRPRWLGRGTDGRRVDSRIPELRSTDIHRPDPQRPDSRHTDSHRTGGSHRTDGRAGEPLSHGSHRPTDPESTQAAHQDGSSPPTTITLPPQRIAPSTTPNEPPPASDSHGADSHGADSHGNDSHRPDSHVSRPPDVEP